MRWWDQMSYIQLLSHKTEWNNAICGHTDGFRDYLTKWNKSEKDRYHVISLICERKWKWSPTLCNLMDCSPPGSSVHGISQTRVLEWVAISFSRGSSQPRDWNILGRRFTIWGTREAHLYVESNKMIWGKLIYKTKQTHRLRKQT